jgi:hypothetical protein
MTKEAIHPPPSHHVSVETLQFCVRLHVVRWRWALAEDLGPWSQLLPSATWDLSLYDTLHCQSSCLFLLPVIRLTDFIFQVSAFLLQIEISSEVTEMLCHKGLRSVLHQFKSIASIVAIVILSILWQDWRIRTESVGVPLLYVIEGHHWKLSACGSCFCTWILCTLMKASRLTQFLKIVHDRSLPHLYQIHYSYSYHGCAYVVEKVSLNKPTIGSQAVRWPFC